ncbi:L-xylulose reductase [Blattella germanica]|nr:L-xylulose reductase [Blattella germanica]
MEINFKLKHVLVTGAGKGIGRALVKRLASLGAEVTAVSRTKEDLDSLAEEVKNIKTIAVDLADWDSTRAAIKSVGPVDCLVNNAAYASLESFLEVKPESFDRSFAINVKAVINVSQVIVEGMIQRKKGGSIVNISSQASQAALADHTVYCGTKGALDMVSRVMALELGPHNIQVDEVVDAIIYLLSDKASMINGVTLPIDGGFLAT